MQRMNERAQAKQTQSSQTPDDAAADDIDYLLAPGAAIALLAVGFIGVVILIMLYHIGRVMLG